MVGPLDHGLLLLKSVNTMTNRESDTISLMHKFQVISFRNNLTTILRLDVLSGKNPSKEGFQV